MAEYNVDNLSQDEILDLISSKFTIEEIEDLDGIPLCAENVSEYFYHEVECKEKDANFCSSCLFGCQSRFKLLNLLRDREQLNTIVDPTKVALQVIRPINHTLDSTIHIDWPIGHKTWIPFSDAYILGRYNHNIHPENNKYCMNVPAICFAPENPKDVKGPFKVGDWVEITESTKNWISQMNSFVGQKVQISKVSGNGWEIDFLENVNGYFWSYVQGHFIPCNDPMPTTMHSKSGEPKENRKYSIKEIKNNPRLLLYLDSEIDYIKIIAHLKNNYLSYYPKNCHNFNQQLYCSESNLNNVGSFSKDSIILVYEDIDLNVEEEKEGEGGILIKSDSKDSSISNIIKLIQV